MYAGHRDCGTVFLPNRNERPGQSPNTPHPASKCGYGMEIEKCKEEGLLEEKAGWLRLTERGLDLSNQVFMEFLKEDA